MFPVASYENCRAAEVVIRPFSAPTEAIRKSLEITDIIVGVAGRVVERVGTANDPVQGIENVMRRLINRIG
jgi:hypothetical protein